MLDREKTKYDTGTYHEDDQAAGVSVDEGIAPQRKTPGGQSQTDERQRDDGIAHVDKPGPHGRSPHRDKS